MAERITPRSQDFSKWYSDIIEHAKLADYSPVRGCMVLRPDGFAIWEVVQRELDKKFKQTGHRNAYFPLFIPENLLNKEKEHVKGFAPQCAVVTHGGGKKLDEALIIRPTSETIINAMYAKWIKSYRDLPVLINQWANVVRWELRTKPFLRTLEFLWQEGHTCHETDVEAKKETLKMLDVYHAFLRDVFAIPVIPGVKTPSEKFAGAVETFCLEGMMQDKKALQMATSHYFGTRFAEAFGIQYQDRHGTLQYVHQTTWGISTRIIGALIMVHSDDQGLVLPPKAASTQIVIVPILQKGKDNSAVLNAVNQLAKDIEKIATCHVDARDEYSAGFKFNEWEIKGVPLRIEVGPRDLGNSVCVFARRDGTKETVKLTDVSAKIPQCFENFQKALYDKAYRFLNDNTYKIDDYATFQDQIEHKPGFFLGHWCGKDSCELAIKEQTKATIRCVPFDQIRESGKCLYCSGASGGRVIFARNY